MSHNASLTGPAGKEQCSDGCKQLQRPARHSDINGPQAADIQLMLNIRRLWNAHGLADAARSLLDASHIDSPLVWQHDSERDSWRASVAIGPVPADHLLVPCLVLQDAHIHSYQMTASWGDHVLRLAPIPVSGRTLEDTPWDRASTGRIGPADQQASAGLDCLETVTNLPAVNLTIEILSEAQPSELPLLVSIRPKKQALLEPPLAPGAATVPIPALSQMEQPVEFARHCCSPISIAMVLQALGHHPETTAFVLNCRHPQHRMFGIWPLNLARAAACGVGGVIRSFNNAAEACRVLNAGAPIVTSIRFEQGQLTAAPLDRTGGHLVVLRGLDADWAWVNDPAATPPEPVARRYPRQAFLRAWLEDRGVGYVLWNAVTRGTP